VPYRVLDISVAQAAPVTTLGAPLSNEGETLLTLRTTLDKATGKRDDWAAGELNSLVNKAYRHVAASVDIAELDGSLLLNTVIDQPFYLLPKQISFIREISIADETNYPVEEGRQLSKIDLRSYRRLPVPLTTGTPTRYFRYGRRLLVIYSDPDDVYPLAVDFKIRPDDLTDDAHSPLLPAEWHAAISHRARYEAWTSLRNYREAAVAQNDYVIAVRPMLDTDAEERGSQEAHLSPAREVRDTYRNRGRH
jgi:hypothetical protein